MEKKSISIDNQETVNIFINRDTIKRLIKDVREIKKSPLENDGIFYKHDEENMLKGYAMIIGPPESLYYGGFYFFELDFPPDYPHSPPKLKYGTNDGITRFHPNLYKNGKVCLSILNTWRGESWSACQTIRSILLTVLSILDDKPLLHEPGFTENSSDFQRYSKIIQYKNVEFSVMKIMSPDAEKYIKPFFLNRFKCEMDREFDKNKQEIFKIIENKKDNREEVVKISCYKMECNLDWKQIYKSFEKEYIKKMN